MKILIQCNYDPRNLGGIEVVTKNLIDVLSNRNFNIDVIAGSHDDQYEQRECYRYFGLKILRKISGAAILRWGNWRFLRAGLRADMILFQEPFPTLLPALFFLRFVFQRRVVVLVHAIPHMPKPIAEPYARIRRTILGRVPVVATTPILLEQLKLPQKSTYPRDVISLCLDENSFDQKGTSIARTTNALPVLPARYMLFLGRLASYKGIEILLRTIKAVPNVHFVIAGAGQLENEISGYIEEHGLRNVVFINRRVSDTEKHHLISACEAFLLPSTNSSEAFAITQIEAMHFGKPIINTQLYNGVNFVAPADEVALTVPPQDEKALAVAVRRIWNDKALAKYLGENGKARKETMFTRQVFQEKWLNYFDGISSSYKKTQCPGKKIE